MLRDLANHRAQVAAIIIVVALGIIMFSGPLLAQRDLRDSINDIYRRTRYEDFAARVESAPLAAAGELSRLPNIEAVEGRVSRDTLASAAGTRLTVRVISVPEKGRPSVNGLILEEGRYLEPGEPGAFMAEHHLSSELGLAPGDTLTLLRDGSRVTLRMTGTVISPEYLRLVRSRAEYVTDPARFGVIFVRFGEAARVFGSGDNVNDFVARVRDGELLDETVSRTGEILEPYGVVGLTTGSEEPGAVTLEFEIDVIGRLALFFAVLLLAVASLALYIAMTQIVFSQQREIGLTRAVGYGRATITAHYLGYGVVLGAAGGVLGVILGYCLARLFIHVYSGIFDLPLIGSTFDALIALAGVAVAMAFSILGAVVPARHAVRMKPADAMRTEAGIALHGAGRRVRPRLSGRSWVPAWLRVSARNLARNRRRTVLTCLGVVATLCLMVTASGGKESLDSAVDKYLNGVLRWDVAAVWSNPIGGEELESARSIDGVLSAEPLLEAPARVTRAGGSVDVQVMAYAEDTDLHGDYPTEGSRARPGPGEIVLNRGITKKLPLHIGDRVTVVTSLGSMPFTVAGFVSEPFGGVAYVNLTYVQGLLERLTGVPGQFNGVVVATAPGRSGKVASALEKAPGVSQVITKSRVLSVFEEMVGAINTIFYIFYIMAFSMGFAILFSMVTVNLFERRREVATIRTLGAGGWRIFSFVTVETVAVVLAAIIPGILLGRLLAWVVIEKLVSSERLAPDVVVSGATLAVIACAALVVMVLSELPSVRKLQRLDLARVTKERAD